MPRPKNKTELLDLSEKNFDTLFELINSFSKQDQQKEFPKGTMNRNICDVLMHLHVWHLMMEDWYKVGMKGQKPDMPAKGYTWKTTPDLNRMIWEKYKDEKLDSAKRKVRSSYKKMRKIIESHSDKELFTKKKYHWTGSTSLGAYLVSATSSHYDWAIKLIKKAMK